MPAPKKGPRFGGEPAHQRLMLANLAAHLFEAEARSPRPRPKAKVLRPYVEKLITKAKNGGVHQQRQVVATIHDKDVTHKLFAEIGPRYADRNGGYMRILKLGPRPGRQRAHGAHRTGVTPAVRSSSRERGALSDRASRRCPAQARRRVRRHRLPRLRRAARAAHGRGRARATRSRRCCAATTSRLDVRGPHRRRGARVGPGGVAVRRSPALDVDGVAARRSTRMLGPEVVVRDARARRRRRSTPATRRTWRAYRYTIVNRPAPDPFLARYAWWVPEPLDLSLLRLARRPVRRRARLRVVLPQGPRRHRRPSAACSSRAGSTSATACCATRSAPPRSAGRWCARSSARSSTWARARSGPARSSASSARGDRGRGTKDRRTSGTVSLGSRLLTRLRSLSSEHLRVRVRM